MNIKIVKYMVEVAIHWEGPTIIMAKSLSETQDYFRNIRTGYWEVQKFLEKLGCYDNARFEGLRTNNKKQLIAQLSFRSKEELDEFCSEFQY